MKNVYNFCDFLIYHFARYDNIILKINKKTKNYVKLIKNYINPKEG